VLDIARARRILESVPDPEIPVLSVIDLGIVRAIEQRGKHLVVSVTPTYSGCPATAVIAMAIENALRAEGFDSIRVETRLAPPWTTDFMSDEAREKLRRFGIAPPAEGSCAGAMNKPAACPRCGSLKLEQISRFGSTPCKSQYRCAECLEPFDYFKGI
jgi:ring-1,2-phenylacetyl-CoA epoxidase subunit PaaD